VKIPDYWEEIPLDKHPTLPNYSSNIEEQNDTAKIWSTMKCVKGKQVGELRAFCKERIGEGVDGWPTQVSVELGGGCSGSVSAGTYRGSLSEPSFWSDENIATGRRLFDLQRNCCCTDPMTPKGKSICKTK
jgi:hypothetical protein